MVQLPSHFDKRASRVPDGAACCAGRSEGVVQRGPLRPDLLSPSRDRLSGATIVRTLRSIDRAALLIAAMVMMFLHHQLVHDADAATVTAPALAGAAGTIWALEHVHAYGFRLREQVVMHLGRIAAAAGIGAIASGAVSLFLNGDLPSSFGMWVAGASLALFATHLGALNWISRARADGRMTPNLVIVGATPSAASLIQQALAARHVNILGIFDDRAARIPDRIEGVPVLGAPRDLSHHPILPFVDRIVLAVPPHAKVRIGQLLEELRLLPNPVTLFVDDGEATTQSTIQRLSDTPLTEQVGPDLDAPGAVVKRLADLVLSALGLVAAAPILLAIAVAIRLDSPGPILFRQRRHGFNNEQIMVLKFRSMRHETADAQARQQVQANDNRVTRVGRFIRRTSLDELPQLFNVLTGEMSLVGPRPHAIGMRSGDRESARLVDEYAWRHRMKPGITGWAQVNGSRGPVDTPEQVRERVRLDVEYIERQSLWFDVYILAITLPRLLGDKAAVR